MARAGRLTFSLIYTGIMLAVVLLPEFLGAGPVGHHEKEEESAVSSDADATLVRNRRNLPQFRRLPDFWGWYKFFMDSGNQEGIEDLDRMYLAYLQNKHRSEEGPTFSHYLTHLSEIYKNCANSDDPECIAESTSKPKAKVVMPASVKAATVRMCNPYYDPYCLFPVLPKAAKPAPAPAPVKAPAPILTPILPMPMMKSPTGFYYYAPVLESFLSDEQKAELLRICNPTDTECLQYHLRAAYGYMPTLGHVPSYTALGCDPTKDPYCKPQMVKKAPSGYFHLYPSCNPATDPLCVSSVVAPAAQANGPEGPPKEQNCNPLFDEGCNPLSATKLSSLTKPVLQYTPKDEPAAPAPAPAAPGPMAHCDPRYDPFCLLRVAAALRKPAPLLPQFQVRPRLGVPGKTKDGYDCYVHYDEGCTPVEASHAAAVAAVPFCHPFDPNCGKFAAPAAPKPSNNGVILPDPHCDPEYDYNCRLRRADAAPAAEEKAADEPAKEEVPEQAAAAPVPQFEDFLRGYMGQYKK